MTVRRTKSEDIKINFTSKNKVSLPTSGIGVSTASGQTRGVKYANGDGYVGELKNGRRHGEGTYAFGTNIKVQVLRNDKAVLDQDSTSKRKGTTVRTPPDAHSGERYTHGFSYAGGASFSDERPTSEHRPAEEFQGAKVSGTWKNDELVSGKVQVLNRNGSVKNFTVSGKDLNLIPSPLEGQALTMRTWEGGGGEPVRLSNKKLDKE